MVWLVALWQQQLLLLLVLVGTAAGSAVLANPTSGMAAAVNGSFVMFGGGLDPNPSALGESYGSRSSYDQLWYQYDLIYARSYHAGAAAAGVLVFGGGWNGTHSLSAVETWRTPPGLFIRAKYLNVTEFGTGPPRHHLAAVGSPWGGGRVFFVGGFRGNLSLDAVDSDESLACADIDILDVSSCAETMMFWGCRTDESFSWDHAWLPFPIFDLAAATVDDHRVLFAGGRCQSSCGVLGISSAVIVFDVATHTYALHNMSNPAHRLAAASVGQYVVLAGGLRTKNTFNPILAVMKMKIDMWNGTGSFAGEMHLDIATYDTKTNPPRFSHCGVGAGQYAYFAGGKGQAGVPTDDVDVIEVGDVSLGGSVTQYYLHAALVVPRFSLACAAVDGLVDDSHVVLFAGGQDENPGDPIKLRNEVDLFCGRGFEAVGETCVQCLPGKYQDLLIGYCKACVEGHYSSALGSFECDSCTEGNYAPSSGMTACVPCPDGMWTNTSAAVACVKCPRGTFRRLTFGCLNCTEGTYSDKEGTAQCKLCPPNSRTNSTFTGCICKDGFYSSSGSPEACESCPSGGECTDGLLYTSKGWWRDSVSRKALYRCDLDGCKGGTKDEQLTGNLQLCAEEYEGPLCGVCSERYSLIGTTCVKCASTALMWIILAALALGLFLYLMYLRQQGSKGAAGVLTKMIVVHLQTVSFVSAYGVKWPAGAQTAWLVVGGLSGAAPLPTTRCLFPGSNFYHWFCVFLLIPAAIVFALPVWSAVLSVHTFAARVLIVNLYNAFATAVVAGVHMAKHVVRHVSAGGPAPGGGDEAEEDDAAAELRQAEELKLDTDSSSAETVGRRSQGVSAAAGVLRTLWRHAWWLPAQPGAIGLRLAVILVLWIMPLWIRKCVEMLNCVHLYDSYYLKADMSLQCYTSTHVFFIVCSVILLFGFLVLLPAAVVRLALSGLLWDTVRKKFEAVCTKISHEGLSHTVHDFLAGVERKTPSSLSQSLDVAESATFRSAPVLALSSSVELEQSEHEQRKEDVVGMAKPTSSDDRGFFAQLLWIVCRVAADWTSYVLTLPMARVLSVYRLLGDGYKKKLFFWDVVVLTRRSLLMIVVVIPSAPFQLLAAGLVVVVAVVLQAVFRPYRYLRFQLLELASLVLVLLMLLLCGVLYLANGPESFSGAYTLSLVLSVVLLTANALLVGAMVALALELSVAIVIKRTAARLAKLLKRLFKAKGSRAVEGKLGAADSSWFTSAAGNVSGDSSNGEEAASTDAAAASDESDGSAADGDSLDSM